MRGWQVCLAVILCGASTALAEVRVPPGFQLIELTNNGLFNWRNSINNLGDVVWMTQSDTTDAETQEIFLYKGGEITQITKNNARDDMPDINDNGTLVWSTTDSPSGLLEIVMYRNGELTFLTDESSQANPAENWGPRINNLGHVAWHRRSSFQCSDADAEIWFFDGERTFQLSDEGLANQAVSLNNRDVVAWTRYDFCVSPWDSLVMVADGSDIAAVSTGFFEPQHVAIADDGCVYWGYNTPGQNTLIRFCNGQFSEISDSGRGPFISDDGRHLVFNRWFESLSTWEIMYYDGAVLTQLTRDDDVWNISAEVNNRGEIVWGHGEYPFKEIWLVARLPSGDLNCDGVVDLHDIVPFVRALVSPQDYAAEYPGCDRTLADLDANGTVEVSDIAFFVNAITAG